MKLELQIPVNRNLYQKIKNKLGKNEILIREINIESIFQDIDKDEEVIRELNLIAKSNNLIIKFIPFDENQYQIDN